MKKYSLHILFFLLLLAPLCKCQWVQQNVPFTSGIFNDMKFINANTGFITNSNSIMIKTTNSGFNWFVNNNFAYGLISLVDSTCMYVTGYNNLFGKIFKSTNCGTTWDTVQSNYSEVYSGLYFFNKDTGIISGTDSYWTYIWKTTDGGQSKALMSTINWSGGGKLFFLKEKVNGEYWGVVYNGHLWYKTINSGINWVSMPNVPDYPVSCIFFINQFTGWATINNYINYVLYTTNGGINWGMQNLPATYSAHDVYFANPRKGWIGFGQNICATSNGGVNWGMQSIPGTVPTSSKLFFLDSLTGWTTAYLYTLAHTTDGGGIINQISNSNEQLSKDYLLYQNYPNPFNPSTRIKYKVESTKQIKLIVFDILGKEITTLVNQKQKPGEYEVTFNATLHGTTSPLPSGVYYYVLYADGVRVDAKKMLMIK